MKKNHIIKGAITLSYVLATFLVLLFGAMIFALIHSHFQPERYQQVIINDSFKAGWSQSNFYICQDCAQPDDIVLGSLSSGMKGWLAIRNTLLFGISLLIIRRVLQILRSVKNIQTFYAGNIDHFRALAYYGVFIFLLGTFNFLYLDGHITWYFKLPLGPLGFSAACLVLAEVFKEGKLLLEDKNAII